MSNKDEGIWPVREARIQISAEHGNDPEKLVEHYIREQAKYRDRMLRPATVREISPPEGP